KPFISFYNSIGFAPTRQQKSSADTLSARRSFLYRTLGIPNIAVRGSDIIEFGPGSGENSDILISLAPRSYKFVDGSDAVLTNLKERFPSTTSNTVVPQIMFSASNILDYQDDALYDLVICEGVLPMQLNPREMATHVLSFVRPGGAAIFTCFDSVSAFSEITRRYLASSIFEDLEYSEGLIHQLVNFFEPDFTHLPGMSRRPEDWVLDSIINPWLGNFFSLQDALEVANDGHSLLGTSPRFLQDWRWFKDPAALDENTTLTSAVSSYRMNIHSLLDARFTGQTRLVDEANSSLIEVTSHIATRVRGHISGNVPYESKEFGGDVMHMIKSIEDLHPQTLCSLQGLVDWSVSRDPSDLEQFRSLWGRGQQYISLGRLN
ncbi:class I SAM-dependent methyltransferase, partial [Actinomycetota bacterium]|nr:class I SAM-dependent methyltransferase [Actinomycetota bacterium]